jgi:hypothetical protein
MPEESPHAHFDRLKKQLQESIVRDYPAVSLNTTAHNLHRLISAAAAAFRIPR